MLSKNINARSENMDAFSANISDLQYMMCTSDSGWDEMHALASLSLTNNHGKKQQNEERLDV